LKWKVSFWRLYLDRIKAQGIAFYWKLIELSVYNQPLFDGRQLSGSDFCLKVDVLLAAHSKQPSAVSTRTKKAAT